PSDLRDLHSFPTRRSSDLNAGGWMLGREASLGDNAVLGFAFGETRANTTAGVAQDRSRDRQTQSQLYAGWHHGNAYLLGQAGFGQRSEEHTSELQSRENLVC